MKELVIDMTWINSFLVCGGICLIAQIIYDNSKLTAGHITSIFVVIGAALDGFGLYDRLLAFAGAGASLPITSFGHSLIHGALEAAHSKGILGIALGLFDLTAVGITAGIVFAFLVAILCKAKS